MKKYLGILLLSLLPWMSWAQKTDVATWAYYSIIHPLNSRWHLSGQTEIRTDDNMTGLYLWYLDGNLRYKINDWLSTSMGIDYIGLHSAATAVRPDVWRTDWRPYMAIIPSWRWGRIKATLNETWAYNWMPETQVEGIQVKGRAFHLVHHRLNLDYPLRDSRFTPFVQLEVRHNDKLERVRSTVGSHYRLNDHTTLRVGYVYQEMHHGTKTHALTVGYRIRI